MGAGVIPLSGIYAGATGADSAQIISQMIPASAVGNVLAINGNGELMPSKDEKKSGKEMKLAGIIPAKYEEAAVQWSQFVMKNFTSALLAGIGIALLDLKVLGAALTPEFMLITVVIILTPVSYTHLTMPTKRIVKISVGAGQ